MAPGRDEFLRVVGFVALLLVWFGAARLLMVLPLGVLPDPVAGLVPPLWLLSPFLLLGGYYYLRADGTAGSPSPDPSPRLELPGVRGRGYDDRPAE